jgi:hypothetical protein
LACRSGVCQHALIVPEYVMKYAERIGANFGTASQLAAQFPEALIITPRRLYA